ncbi:MAG TPA: O-antigen ligase family protein [Terriglobia bacterium]|nr:O-antigen ligase family protein [Terriglobia bacterium]
MRTAFAPRADRHYRILLMLLLCAQLAYMVIYIAPPPGQVTMAADPNTRLIKLALLALGTAVVLSRWQVARRLLKEMNRFLLLFMALAVLSLVWSIDRSVTAARLVTLASMVMTCFAFGAGAWNPRRFQDVVRPAISLVLIASLIIGVIDPNLVTEVGNTISLKDAWRGLTAQKNVFGELASFGAILWLHAGLARQVRGWRALAGAGIALTCLILSRSSTSLFCTAYAAVFLIILARSGPAMRRYMPYVVAAFTGMSVLYVLAIMNVVPGIERILIDPVLSLTGKSLTFSGRTVIWQIVGWNIGRHPYLGSGYGAYWGAGPVPSSPSYAFIRLMWGFWPTEAHNGYLDIRNDLGDAGLACLVAYIGAYILQCVRLYRFDRAQAALFLAFLFQQVLLNLSESTWLNVNNFCFTIMTVATVMISRALNEHSRASRVAGAEANARRTGFAGIRIPRAWSEPTPSPRDGST